MNFIGTRNGLFYAPAYVSLGMVISEQDSSKYNLKKNVICFCGSMILLILESILFIVVIRTGQTILWLSVFPASYFLYKVLLEIKIEVPYTASIFMRKLSTLIYAIHGFFLMLFGNMSFGIPYFLVVSISSAALGAIIIVLSEKFKFLKYLY